MQLKLHFLFIYKFYIISLYFFPISYFNHHFIIIIIVIIILIVILVQLFNNKFSLVNNQLNLAIIGEEQKSNNNKNVEKN